MIWHEKTNVIPSFGNSSKHLCEVTALLESKKTQKTPLTVNKRLALYIQRWSFAFILNEYGVNSDTEQFSVIMAALINFH